MLDRAAPSALPPLETRDVAYIIVLFGRLRALSRNIRGRQTDMDRRDGAQLPRAELAHKAHVMEDRRGRPSGTRPLPLLRPSPLRAFPRRLLARSRRAFTTDGSVPRPPYRTSAGVTSRGSARLSGSSRKPYDQFFELAVTEFHRPDRTGHGSGNGMQCSTVTAARFRRESAAGYRSAALHVRCAGQPPTVDGCRLEPVGYTASSRCNGGRGGMDTMTASQAFSSWIRAPRSSAHSRAHALSSSICREVSPYAV